ncbi:MAG: DUF4397 domain-containing protein, partial [Bacteroidota bacterium]
MSTRYTRPPTLFSLLALLLLAAAPAWAQTANVQVIHNAADPGAAVVDIYIDAVSSDDPAIEDLAFRDATGYLELPAGSEIVVTVAPGDSESDADGLASFPFTLDDGVNYQLIANGVLDPTQFEANPNGEDIGFTLFANEGSRLQSSAPPSVEFNVVHGSTDAPTVDVAARGVGTLVDDATYGDITGYIGVPAAEYVLDVTTADGSTVVASFEADLSAAAGAAITILASGFLSPENEDDTNGEPAGFGLLVVRPGGQTALLPPFVMSDETARAQIIHNAADPGAAVVDIYIEEISTDDPAVEDLAFRTATEFIDLPAEQELTITVAPGDSESAADGLA